MASHKDVSNHNDLSKAGPAPGKDTNPRHAHPHESVPVRIAKESSFAAPGLDTPAERQRPAREAGTDRDHPLNKAIRDQDKSLTGPQLSVHPLAPVQASTTYTDPEFTGRPGETFRGSAKPWTPESDMAAANANFEDCSELLMRPRGGSNV